ncbi:MAG: ribonuclease Y [Candidatus Latescibacterota bacterium]|nr:MAG: ribonuclease Y [Candidatus Latescibacterota bacterium]
MNPLIPILAGLGAAVVGVVVGALIGKRASAGNLANAKKLADSIISDAQKSVENFRKEAEIEVKDEFLKMKLGFEEKTRETRESLKERELSLINKESNLARKVDLLAKNERGLEDKERSLERKQQHLDGKLMETNRMIAEQNVRLERIAGMSKDEAKEMLLRNLESEAKLEAARRVKEIRETAERDAEKQSQKIIALAIQRYAADQSVETTVSVVDLPSDEMKGRIIGKEGRNIRAFEKATGVDIVIDDTPEAVTLSSFDPIRREVARLSLQKLVEDGRIHPGRIEEVVTKVADEMDRKIQEHGEDACMELNIHGIHPELVKLVGKLRYRTSYGQNCLKHSMEVAYLCGIIATELKLDQQLAKRAGLLHDIGKAASHESDGSHTEIGAELAERYGESGAIVNAVAGHHQDVESTSLYTPIVEAADAISGARPGARRETLEAYIKRLEKLEQIASSFEGVDKAFAIQAGREIRILVSHDEVDDAQASKLAFDISRKLEKELEYPGQIKVVVIRETRAVEYAK